jgi:hypothetical protein
LCRTLEEKEVELNELEYNGEKFYYKKVDDPLNRIGYVFYRYDKSLNAYIAVDFSDPLINDLLEIVDPFEI